MAALPTGIASVPATLIQFFELLFGVGKLGVAGFQDFGRGGLEWVFGGDALDPALLGKLFVVGKAEAKEEFDGFVGFGSFGIVVGFCFAFCFWFFGFGGYGFRIWGAVAGPFEFVEEFFVQAKGLLPSFQFVTGELGFFLILAKVELHVNVGHGFSL